MPLPTFTTWADGAAVWLMMPNAIDNARVELQARGDPIEMPNGARRLRLINTPQRERYEYEYIVRSYAEFNELLGFVKGRDAQRLGFWTPTWQAEFDVRGYILPNAGSYFVDYTPNGYAENFFPLGRPYRRIAILRGDHVRFHEIDNVSIADPAPGVLRMHMGEGGGTGDVTLFDGGPLYRVRNDYRLLWLRYGRWDTDELLYEQLNGDGAGRVVLPFIEVPTEAEA